MDDWFDKAASFDLNGRCRLLWTDENPFYDTVVRVKDQNGGAGGTTFNCHKIILAIGSRKFASLLYGEPTQNRDSVMAAVEIPFIIEIEDLSSSIMKMVLEFLYSEDIKEDLDWAEVGGLSHAAKQLEIPRLSEFCENLFETQLSCEQILVLFQQITTLTKENCEWPSTYYLELLSLCYAYILRNGEVILRSNNFMELSRKNVESFISSDFLVCEEATLYNALKRWARRQCKKQKLDYKKIQNCRKMLREPSDDEESLGLLRHVRFPLMDSDTFSLKIHRSSSSLIPDKVAEIVYQYLTISEPTIIFLEKARHTEMEITSQKAEHFKEHVQRLTKVSLPPIFATSDKSSFNLDSKSQTNSKSDSSSNVRFEMPAETNVEVVKNVQNKSIPATNKLANKQGEGNRIVIKMEPSSDGENESPSVGFVKEKLKIVPQPPPESKLTPPTPLKCINQDSSARDKMLKRKMKTANGEDETVQKIQKIVPTVISEQESSILRIHNSTKEGSSTDIAYSDNKDSSSLALDSLVDEVYMRIVPTVTCEQESSVLRIHNGTKEVSSAKIAYSDKNGSSSLALDLLKDEVYMKKNQKIKYGMVVKECSKQPGVTKIILDDVEIDTLPKLGKRLLFICLPKITEFLLKVVNIKTGALPQILKSINLDYFIFFYRENESFRSRLKDLWDKNVNVKLSFNGVTILDVRFPELAINYVAQKSPFLDLNSQSLTNIKSLKLGNCTIDKSNWLEGKYCKQLTDIKMVCVKGLKCVHILGECLALESFSIWPVENQQNPTFCLDDIKSEKIRYFSANNLMLKTLPKSTRVYLNMKEMCLVDCSWDPSFIETMPKHFPNLRNIFIVNKFDPPGPEMLKTFLNMTSIVEVCMWNFNSKYLDRKEFVEQKKILANLKPKQCSSDFSFALTRGKKADAKWEGSKVTSKDLMKRIYKSFGFETFYTLEAWSKYFWVNYDYF